MGENEKKEKRGGGEKEERGGGGRRGRRGVFFPIPGRKQQQQPRWQDTETAMKKPVPRVIFKVGLWWFGAIIQAGFIFSGIK